MIPTTYVRFSSPITLSLHIGPDPSHDRCPMDFSRDGIVRPPGLSQRITHAYLSPIPVPLAIYGPDDFAAACGDSMDDHAERVLEILGSAPVATLQALLDGGVMPAVPPRIPREVAHWSIAHVLRQMGKLSMVDAMIANLSGDFQAIASAAWEGKAVLNRRSPLVMAAYQCLGLSMAECDDLFLAEMPREAGEAAEHFVAGNHAHVAVGADDIRSDKKLL